MEISPGTAASPQSVCGDLRREIVLGMNRVIFDCLKTFSCFSFCKDRLFAYLPRCCVFCLV